MNSKPSNNTSPHLSKSLLTPNGLNSLIEQNHKGITIQIISPELLPEKQPGSQSLKYKVVISDGSAKHKAVLGNKAAYTFRTAGAPNFAIVTVWDIMQISSNPAKKLIILTDVEIVNTSQKSSIGYPIEYQEWQQQVQQYENLQKNNNQSSNSKPFYFEDHGNNDSMPPMEEVLPKAVIPENNSISLSEFRFSKHESRSAKEINSASKQEAKQIIQERITFPTNNFHAENENKNKIKSLNPQSNPSSDVSPAKDKQKSNPNLHNSLTTATETDSDVSIEIEKPKPTSLKTQNSASHAKVEKEDIASERNIKKLIHFPVYGMNVRQLEDQDSHQFHQAIGMDQAFSADFLDKNGNKITAVFFGEQAEVFLNQFRDYETHIITSLTGKMSIEK